VNGYPVVNIASKFVGTIRSGDILAAHRLKAKTGKTEKIETEGTGKQKIPLASHRLR